MSRQVVVDTLSTEAASYFAGVTPAVAFYKTINQQNDITDPQWATVSFSSYSTQNICYDSKATGRIESGICDVAINARPGTDPDILNAIADDAEDHFNGFRQSGVVIVNTISANDAFRSGDATNWYELILSLEYQYFY